ncbi:unnamed protein product [Closterium sp. NIES-54]
MLLAPEGDPDAPAIPTPRSYAEAITGPYSSQWQTAMDAEMASWKSTDTYVDAVPPSGANIVDGMWIFRVKQPPGSPPVFKARYIARGFSQRHGVDFFQTFSPTPKMTPPQVLLHQPLSPQPGLASQRPVTVDTGGAGSGGAAAVGADPGGAGFGGDSAGGPDTGGGVLRLETRTPRVQWPRVLWQDSNNNSSSSNYSSSSSNFNSHRHLR